jgi:HD-GYP domain-containing protein (c-di-GMP phosphodiesterase class II)
MNKELELSYTENQSLIDKIESFLEIPQVMFSTRDMNELLSFCYKKLLSIVSDVDCSLLGVNREEKIEFLSGSGIDYEKLNSLNVNAQKYLNKKKILFKNFEEGEFIQEMELQINQPELHDLIASVQQVLIIPAVSKDHYYGHLAFYNFQGSSNKLTFDDYRIAEFFSGFLKAFLMIKEFSELEMDIQKETIHAIIQLLEKHDPYTKGHSENVARLSMEFATYLGLSEKRIQDLYWAGIVHDMGKILIPQSLLNKPSRLTTGEFEEIKKHPVYAYDVFKNSYPMKEIALYVKHHHEKYNGKGYPDGLKGKAIPYESRILCIADAWDAMTSERSYKDRLNKTEAISEIMQNKGEQFDPKLTDEWLSFISNHQ